MFKQTLLFIVATTTLFAGGPKPQKEKITTQLFVPPMIQVTDDYNYDFLTVSYAMGDAKMLGKTRIDKKDGCSSKGFYTSAATSNYKMTYQKPTLYIVARDVSGKVVFARSINRGNTSVDFTEKCVKTKNLETYFSEHYESFLTRVKNNEHAQIEKSIKGIVQKAVFAHYEEEYFYLYGVKRGEATHPDLMKAFANAEVAYAKIAKEGYSQDALDKLTESKMIWDKALEESDLENKEARINKKISLKVLENLTIVSMFLGDYDAATAYLAKFDNTSFGNSTTTNKHHFSQVQARTSKRLEGIGKNGAMLSSMEKISLALAQKDKYAKTLKIEEFSGHYSALAETTKEAEGEVILNQIEDALKQFK